MTPIDDLIATIAALRRKDLETWINQNLVTPQQDAGALYFTDMECARVHFICTLHYDLEIDADTLPVLLSLVDQLYDTRQRLLSLSAAIAAQDESIQTAILAAMKSDDESPPGSTSKV
jgi:chaperone modulatory protein CbpM